MKKSRYIAMFRPGGASWTAAGELQESFEAAEGDLNKFINALPVARNWQLAVFEVLVSTPISVEPARVEFQK